METTRRYLRVDRSGIAFVRFVLEGYDGLAVLTTLDAARGDVMLCIAPGCEDEVDEVLNDLKAGMMIEEADGEDGK